MTLAKEYKKWPFSGINFSGGFPDLFLEVLTGINLFLRFLYSAPRHVLPKTTSGHNSLKIYATIEIFFFILHRLCCSIILYH